MDIFGKFKAVSEQSLYDFYGIASLNIDSLDQNDRSFIDMSLQTLQKTYMEGLRTRFANWNPNGKKALTVDDMIQQLKNDLYDLAAKSANKMSRLGNGFNLMDAVKHMRGEDDNGDAKVKAEEARVKNFADNLSKFDKDRYPKIAKGVIKLHEAKSTKDIILAIDYMNDLQHWGGAILVDLLSGQRDPSNSENNKIFNEIMEVKKHAKSPLEFANKMSNDIRKIVQESERLKRAGI